MTDLDNRLQLSIQLPCGELDDDPWVISQAIFDLVDEYLQPSANSPISVVSVAEGINQLFPTNRKEEGSKENESPGSFLWELWELFVRIAMQIPWRHVALDRLVDIIRALHDLPGQTIIFTDSWGEKNSWRDLPNLRFIITETWNQGMYYPGCEPTDIQKRTWHQSFHAFLARLSDASLFDLTRYGRCTIQVALEEEPSRESVEFESYGQELDVELPLAAIWILLNGTNFLQLSKIGVSEADEGTLARGRNWKGEGGLNMGRWIFWKRRLAEIRCTPWINEATRLLSGEAEDFMNEIEVSTDMPS